MTGRPREERLADEDVAYIKAQVAQSNASGTFVAAQLHREVYEEAVSGTYKGVRLPSDVDSVKSAFVRAFKPDPKKRQALPPLYWRVLETLYGITHDSLPSRVGVSGARSEEADKAGTLEASQSGSKPGEGPIVTPTTPPPHEAVEDAPTATAHEWPTATERKSSNDAMPLVRPEVRESRKESRSETLVKPIKIFHHHPGELSWSIYTHADFAWKTRKNDYAITQEVDAIDSTVATIHNTAGFNDDHWINFDQWRRLINREPFAVLYLVDRSDTIVGYTLMAALKPEPFEVALIGQYRDCDFRFDHIVTIQPNIPLDLYIFTIEVRPDLRDLRFPGLLLFKALRSQIKRLSKKPYQLMRVSTVCTTEEGCRMARLLKMEYMGDYCQDGVVGKVFVRLFEPPCSTIAPPYRSSSSS